MDEVGEGIALTKWDDEGDDIIAEVPEYIPKSDYSKALITKEAVQRCLTLRAVEMKPGHWNMKVFPNGIQKEYNTDTRKAFISSVEALRNLLYPEMIRNKQYWKREQMIRAIIDNLYHQYSYKERIKEANSAILIF